MNVPPGQAQPLIVTTTPSIEGRQITAYLGLVTGEAILGANIFKDLFAGVRDIVGGRSADLRARAVAGSVHRSLRAGGDRGSAGRSRGRGRRPRLRDRGAGRIDAHGDGIRHRRAPLTSRPSHRSKQPRGIYSGADRCANVRWLLAPSAESHEAPRNADCFT